MGDCGGNCSNVNVKDTMNCCAATTNDRIDGFLDLPALFLELGTFAEEPEPYSESLSQFSSRGGQIPGIDDGEMPVVPARSEESTVTGQHTMTGIHQSF